MQILNNVKHAQWNYFKRSRREYSLVSSNNIQNILYLKKKKSPNNVIDLVLLFLLLN